MDSGFYAACTGLVSRTQSLDTIANNLANVSTTAFRGRHNTFSSALAAAHSNGLSVLNQDANDFGTLSGTRLDESQGSLQNTGNPLDLAVEGPGYFAVQTASGTMYTRAGNLRVSQNRQLVTQSGDTVLSASGAPITIVGQPVSIANDGTISANGAVAGKLKLVEFDAKTQLESVGTTYYKAPAGSEKDATNSSVRQGMLEASNVNPVTSMVELIGAQRDVETMRRVLTMFNSEIDKTAAQDLPRVS
jgi:flagellar basal-body rod protein FlgF